MLKSGLIECFACFPCTSNENQIHLYKESESQIVFLKRKKENVYRCDSPYPHHAVTLDGRTTSGVKISFVSSRRWASDLGTTDQRETEMGRTHCRVVLPQPSQKGKKKTSTKLKYQ